MISLREFAQDFASALMAVDSKRIPHKTFLPGIGPFGEAEAVRLALVELKQLASKRYAGAAIKKTPDLLIPNEWAIELKILRPFGNNGNEAEHWSENVLHPMEGNTSALGDGLKLLGSGFSERKALVIFGFEHSPPQIALETVVLGFEVLAKHVVGLRLGDRIEEVRTNLVHPVHQQLRVFAYEVLGRSVDASSS
jgi:hypothetical protein